MIASSTSRPSRCAAAWAASTRLKSLGMTLPNRSTAASQSASSACATAEPVSAWCRATASARNARGAVALREAGAGEIVDPGWLDCQGQLVEGSQDPEVHCFSGPEFVVAAADVLD